MLHIPFQSMAEKVEPLKYGRTWDVPQLYGQYHRSRIGSKYPIPGTAVLDDQKHTVKKEADVARFHKTIEERAVKRHARGPIIRKKSEFAAKSYLNQIINEPIEEISQVIDTADTFVSKALPKGDTEREKKRWWKNMAKGNSNYVGYAISAGYRAFDYQDPATGDHGLHVAVRTGNLMMVSQLMKYKADSELRNRLGYFPINYAWDFWKKYKQQHERDPQENLTCSILFTMLSYGAGAERQDQHGNTALHKAAQYGPLRAVLLLMGFRADPHVRNNLNQRPVDLARKYKQPEIAKIFGMWDMIVEQMANTDFQVVWKKFIKDVEQEISAEKSASDVLFELQMEEGIKTLDRQKAHGDFKIDDPQMRHVKEKTVLDGLAKIPRPWELGWDQWVELQKPDMDEIYGLKKKEDPKKKHKHEPKVMTAEDAGEVVVQKDHDHDDDENASDGSAGEGEIEGDAEQEQLLVKAQKKAGSVVGLLRHAADKLPPQSEKPARPWHRTSTGIHVDFHEMAFHSDVIDDKTGVGFFNEELDEEKKEANARQLAASSLGDNDDDDDDDDDDSGGGGGGGSSFRPVDSIATPSSAAGAVPGGDEDLFGDSLSLYSSSSASVVTAAESSRPGSQMSNVRPVSQARARALGVGQKILMDAKFGHFTKRPCTASAMLVPLRTGNAPLENTEEEFDTIRLLSISERDAEARKADKKDTLIGKKADVTKDPMGAYTSAVEFVVENPRTKLLDRVAPKYANLREEAEEKVRIAKEKKEAGGGDPKRQQVDLVQGRRQRFIDYKLLPPTRRTSAFHEMKKAREDKEASELEELGNMAFGEVEGKGSTASSALKARNRARQKFIKGVQVPYGKSRLQSSHNMKGKIDAPWTYVGSYYHINMPI